MTYKQLLKYYGGSSAAAGHAIGTYRQKVHGWRVNGIPLEAQIAYEIATKGQLRADVPEMFRKQAMA